MDKLYRSRSGLAVKFSETFEEQLSILFGFFPRNEISGFAKSLGRISGISRRKHCSEKLEGALNVLNNISSPANEVANAEKAVMEVVLYHMAEADSDPKTSEKIKKLVCGQVEFAKSRGYRDKDRFFIGKTPKNIIKF